MSQTSFVTLELRTPHTCQQTAEAMASFLMALPPPPHDLRHLAQPAPTVTLEFLNQGQTIYVLLTVPQSLVEYISSQLAANYPEILIKPLEHNPLDEFKHDGKVVAAELRLHAPSYFSLRTYKEAANQDLLANVLSVFSKLQENETGLIQLVCRKSRSGWKKRGRQFALMATNSAQTTAITAKLAQTSFQLEMRMIVRAPTHSRAQALLQSQANAYLGYQTEFNQLNLHKPLLQQKQLQTKILSRQAFALFSRRQFVSLDELASLFHLPNQSLSLIKNIAWGKNLLGEPPANLPAYSTVPENELQDVNFFARAEFKNQDQVFGIKRADRRRHMYAIGKSGTGKSTLLANMIIHDLKHNEGLAVIDPHGDLIETVLNYIPKHRINDVIVFDPADPQAVVKLNLFEGGSTVHRELIASGIVAIFQKMYANSWGPRLEYILRNTLLTLLSQNAKLEDVLRMLTDVKFRAKVIDSLDDAVLKNFWVAEFNTMQDRQRNESIAPILNKVGQFVTSPLVRNVVNTQKSSFDIENVMNEGKILLVNVSQGKLGEDNAALLGAMMITKIQLAAMNRVYMDEDKRRDFYLYIDEFQNFATTSFIKILSEARKYRLNLILANQYMDQIPDDVKSAIFGNAGSMVSFILGATDADWMKKEFGDKYTSEDLVNLGRYQIITKLMIDNQASYPFPAQTLNLATSANQNRAKVLTVSRERYARVK